ncbi:MAG: ATP-dependent DNA helicase RecG [Defluviitaleaceae bacterium]|nr:ATP-dependent DNA helicase RecG [Defluviitaleaceae bacterium]MCL2203798.1 ATP-dependent DNA helicase RecG [Defluviitaleaceae bacterium]MCL2239267.1 ATP-dependent DNA helicase RecG [Defluviitaleaceae bacterium]
MRYNGNMHISTLPGIGPKRAQLLEQAGIPTVADLLNRFPRDYDDRSELRTVESLTPGAVQTIRGVLSQLPGNVPMPRRGAKPLTLTKAVLKDGTGTLELVWFNQPYLQKNFKAGREYIFTGAVRLGYNGRLQMQSPDYEIAGETALGAGRIVPLYTPPPGFSQKTFRALVHQGLSKVADFPDDLPAALRERHGLCHRAAAVRNIHFPESDAMFLEARRRLVFEELFFMQLALFEIKGRSAGQGGIVFGDVDTAPVIKQFSFTPTQAQEKVLAEIAADMQSGYTMNRLIQGDVGSGKTAVAMAAAYLAIKNGYQAAIMAPTEVLARQHFNGFSRLFAPLGIETALLAGSLSAASRKNALAHIGSGEARMIVGTHALVQPGVEYARLGLVITDEQHRFGVNQRLTLMEKGAAPHTLVMTATPIPRTLALILYGDLDISVIDALPPGRVPIKTYAVDSRYRPRVHSFIRKEVAAGRQAYIICPAIEEGEGDTHSVLQYTADARRALPGLAIACLHGRMKPAEKQAIMDAFCANRANVLISTTVIEVGIHVPNATLIVIENAERFGLSQLHQLRGRVGRGNEPSHCVLISDAKAPVTQARLQAMVDTTDGFALAEQDLEQRGAGDFFGTRQHGLPAFTIANLYRDMDILKEAQDAARIFHTTDSSISNREKMAVKNRLAQVL